MAIADAFKTFFYALNGTKPNGANIEDVVKNGTIGLQPNGESSLASRVDAIENDLSTSVFTPAIAGTTMSERVRTLEYTTRRYHDYAVRKCFLKSSTENDGVLSEKVFAITISDSGVLTGTEVTPHTITWTVDPGIEFRTNRWGWELESGDTVYADDSIMLYAIPPEGRTLSPAVITGATHDDSVSIDNPAGKGITVTGDVTITLSLVAESE